MGAACGGRSHVPVRLHFMFCTAFLTFLPPRKEMHVLDVMENEGIVSRLGGSACQRTRRHDDAEHPQNPVLHLPVSAPKPCKLHALC